MLVTIADLNHQENAREGIELAKQLSLLYDEYVNTEDDDSHLRGPGIHPSELKCLRQTTYSLLNYPKKSSITKFWRQRFKVGHALHAMFQTDMEKLARRSRGVAHQMAKQRGWVVEFEREVKISRNLQRVAKELNLEGHADGVFTFREHMLGPAVLRVLAEFKTESPDEYTKLKEPRPDHIKQAHLYMAALDIPVTWFFYFSKGTQNNTNSEAPWLTVFNPEIWAETEKECRTVLEFAKQKKLGPREESIGCDFCPYTWDCQPAWPSTKVKPNSSLLRMPKVG